MFNTCIFGWLKATHITYSEHVCFEGVLKTRALTRPHDQSLLLGTPTCRVVWRANFVCAARTRISNEMTPTRDAWLQCRSIQLAGDMAGSSLTLVSFCETALVATNKLYFVWPMHSGSEPKGIRGVSNLLASFPVGSQTATIPGQGMQMQPAVRFNQAVGGNLGMLQRRIKRTSTAIICPFHKASSPWHMSFAWGS